MTILMGQPGLLVSMSGGRVQKKLLKKHYRNVHLGTYPYLKKKSTKIFVWGSHLRLLRCSKNMTFIFWSSNFSNKYLPRYMCPKYPTAYLTK